MKRRVLQHFRSVDPVLYRAAMRAEIVGPSTAENLFADLCEAIICQQLSDKAGATIFSRFESLFPRKRITAKRILEIPDENIRSVGPSAAKIKYLKGLARAVHHRDIDLKKLTKLSDEQVTAELIKLHGIGPWTAEMFLMFSLGREDIFSHGDLGLRKAIQKLYGFKKEPTKKQIETIARKWSPYRTWACRILWRSLEL